MTIRPATSIRLGLTVIGLVCLLSTLPSITSAEEWMILRLQDNNTNSSCSLDNIDIIPAADVVVDSSTVTFFRFKTHVVRYEFISNPSQINAETPPCVRAEFEINVDRQRCKGILQFLDGDPYYRRFELNLVNTTYNVSVSALQLGSCLLDSNITGEDADGKVEIITERDILVHVIREPTILDQTFQLLMMSLIVFGNIAMGLKTDVAVVIETIKRPIGPAIALFIQFAIQPAVAYGLIRALSIYPEIVAFGFFVVGCSPSGTASNFHTFLLGGDVSLAVTVTLCSTILSLGFYPLWIYTLGRFILSSSPTQAEIPFENIILTLMEVVVPVFIGVILKTAKPKVAAFLLKWIVQPFLALVILYLITAGLYTNFYLFDIVSWQVLFAGCLLPYIGFGIGIVAAIIAKQPKDRRIAIMIEAGLQNVYIPIFMLRQTFDKPDSDLASVGPVGSLLLGPIPLYIAEIFIFLRGRYKKSARFQKVVDRVCCCCCPTAILRVICPVEEQEDEIPIMAEDLEDLEDPKSDELGKKIEASIHASVNPAGEEAGLFGSRSRAQSARSRLDSKASKIMYSSIAE